MPGTKHWLVSWLAALLIAACASSPSPTPTTEPTPARPTRTPPPPATAVATVIPTVIQAGKPLSEHRGQYFAASGVCTPCHENLVDDAGADVSIDAFWRSSMMANSARDPFWQAAVASETEARPESAEAIEDTCATCHMPMARYTETIEGTQSRVFGDGLSNPEHPHHDLAMDGVSCTLCHQVLEAGLGFQDSYNGGFTVDEEAPPGERLVYGPYAAEEHHVAAMQAASGYVFEQGLHLGDSELCGTCHTFFVSDPASQDPSFPLQTTYFEWFYSDHRSVDTCQDCHMPEAVGGVKIATESEFPRSPFAEHVLVGGNAYMLQLLMTFIEELSLTASAEQFDTTRQRTVDLLQNETLDLEIQELRLAGGRLSVDLRLRNLAGHKFPSGFPSRRAWIRIAVEDRTGETVFESGGFDGEGRIVENSNDQDAATYEQHYLAVVQPEQVQIYESILGDTTGAITTNLMGAREYLKDNRIMPMGQDKFGEVEAIQPRGNAIGDEDFQGGVDEIQYSIDLRGADGPFTVTIEVLFQSIAPSWIDAMRGLSAVETERFVRLYEAVPNEPVVVAKEVFELVN